MYRSNRFMYAAKTFCNGVLRSLGEEMFSSNEDGQQMAHKDFHMHMQPTVGFFGGLFFFTRESSDWHT